MVSEAIQILTSEKDEEDHNQSRFIIKTVERHENGPSLQEVLCDPVTKDLPIFVFSVAGKTRGGKSFLLNLMAKYLESEGSRDWKRGQLPSVFQWRGGLDSITKGLWMCPKIYKTRNMQGHKVGVLLLDNQGLFDGEQTDGVSIAMSGISTALSHLQMFNLKEKITTIDLETVWRNMAPVEVESTNTTLLFLVRDFLEADSGCGLGRGHKYISEEMTRGTEENKIMWRALQNSFKNIECLLLPHPGIPVTKQDYSGDLSVIEENFMDEIDLFFRKVFAPEKLNVTSDSHSLTGAEIFNVLRSVDGKVADDSLSFLNVFTEHGNQEKLEKLLSSFDSRVAFCRDNVFATRTVMDEVLQSAKLRFKGPSAEEFSSKLRMILVEKVNTRVKEWILKFYESAVNGKNIEHKHKTEWPNFCSRLNNLVGTEDEKLATERILFFKAAAIYYENLREEMQANFQASCTNKSLNDLKGYDDVFVSKEFLESKDFQRSGCRAIKDGCQAIWLREKRLLMQSVQFQLIEKVSALTKLDTDWLYKARKQQYEYFEAFTWGNVNSSECHWSVIEKEDHERLKEFIGYAMFKKHPSKYSEDELQSMKPTLDEVKAQSSDYLITLSCVFVIFRQEEKEIIAPVFRVKTSNCVVFMDTTPRVYKSWEDFEENNKLPDCICCYPLGGEYNKKSGFQIVFAETPASKVGTKVLGSLDIAGKGVSLAAVGALGLAAAVPTMPALAVGGAIAAVSSGIYGLVRGITKITDKVSHRQSLNAGDILNTAGNTLAIATVGASAVAKILMDVGREAMVAHSVVQGLSTVTTLVLNSNDSIDVPSLLNEIIDISTKVLFYFNSKSSNEVIDVIKRSYNLQGNPSKQEVLRALVKANTVGSAISLGDREAIQQFVSIGMKTLISDLLKFVDPETKSLITTVLRPDDENELHVQMQKLHDSLKKENANLNSALIKFLNDLSTNEGLYTLKEAFIRATRAEKNQFSLLMRNLIYSVSAKLEKANRVLDSTDHEGHHLISYGGVEFHPVEEILEQINSAGIKRNGHDIVDCLKEGANRDIYRLLKKILKSLCHDANVNWTVQQFIKCLADNWYQITKTFEDDLKRLGEKMKQFDHPSCIAINRFFNEIGIQGGLGSCLLEKVLDKSRVVDRAKYTNERNAIIVPGWEGLVDRLYCYSFSENTPRVGPKDLVGQLTKESTVGYQEVKSCNGNIVVLKPKRKAFPTYYIYRNSSDGDESGLIYCDK